VNIKIKYQSHSLTINMWIDAIFLLYPIEYEIKDRTQY